MDITLFDELDKAGLLPAPARPHEFGITIREFMEAKGLTEGPARKALTQAVEAGILVVHKMQIGAGACPFVYCRPSEWPPKG